MNIDTQTITTITEANQNFSRVAKVAEKNGQAVIFKNNKPKFLLIDVDSNPYFDITDDEKYSKQVKNATKYLLLNTMVPLFFFSVSSALTKKLKNIYRFPIMFASLVTGSLLVKNAVENKKN